MRVCVLPCAARTPKGSSVEFVMLGLIALLIFFMFRNGKKRQKAMQELQAGLVPGAEVILQPGIFATVEEIDEEDQRLTVRSGTSTLIVHRNMVAQIVPEHIEADEPSALAPDDDPAFSERFSEQARVDEVPEADETAADSTPRDTDQSDPDSGDSPSDNRSA